MLALAFSTAPLVVLLLGAKDFDAIDEWPLQVSATIMIASASLAAFLRLCLIVVSRNRVRLLYAAKMEGKEKIKIYFISLAIQNYSEVATLFGYVAMAVFLLLAVWT